MSNAAPAPVVARPEANSAAPARPPAAPALRRDLARPLDEGDLDAVARLFLSRFRRKGLADDARARGEVARYMRQLYLEGPTRGDEPAAMVQVSKSGEIGAFVGSIRQTYLFDGRPIVAGVNGALMAADQAGNSLAVIQLLRELHRRPLDLMLTDSANRASLAIGRAMKYHVHPVNSLEWAYVFEPAALLLHKLAQKSPLTPAFALRPLARAVDLVVAPALRRRVMRKPPAGWTAEPVDAAAFVAIAPDFLEGYRLRPQWSARELGWLAGQAGQRRGAGPLHFHVVRDNCGRIVGCWAFYGEKGGVARFVHTASTSDAWGGVIAHMLETARAMGCIGAHGGLRQCMLGHLHAYPGLFYYYAGGTMIYSNRADVMEAVQGGGAFFGGFAGDRWTRLATDEFGG